MYAYATEKINNQKIMTIFIFLRMMTFLKIERKLHHFWRITYIFVIINIYLRHIYIINCIIRCPLKYSNRFDMNHE